MTELMIKEIHWSQIPEKDDYFNIYITYKLKKTQCHYVVMELNVLIGELDIFQDKAEYSSKLE